MKAGALAGSIRIHNKLLVAGLVALCGLIAPSAGNSALARRHTTTSHNTSSSSTSHSSSGHHKHVVTQFLGSHKHVSTVAAASASHHGRHHRKHEPVVAHASRHAYPLGIFMLKPPEFEHSALPPETASQIQRAFTEGYADSYDARSLVRAGLVTYHPLHGGIYWRREPVKYIILHSTETGIPVNATRVIEGWGSMGRRHPGAQYVVDRDGTIYQAVDPDLATVHVNIFKTLPGINNDNSIGIEMNHTGHQDYPEAERQSVLKLITYLQNRYNVGDEHIVTHRYAQQGDHTDPVNFDFEGFLAQKNHFRNRAIAYKVNKINAEAAALPPVETVTAATTFLQPHGPIKTTSVKVQVGTRSDTNGGAPSSDQHPDLDPAKGSLGADTYSPPASASPPTYVAVPMPRAAATQASRSATGRSAAGRASSSDSLRGPIEMDPDDLNDLKKQPVTTAAPEKSETPGTDTTMPENEDESSPDGMKFFVH